MTTPTERAIARDLDLCDLGIALTSGKRRLAFEAHRKRCFEAIKIMRELGG